MPPGRRCSWSAFPLSLCVSVMSSHGARGIVAYCPGEGCPARCLRVSGGGVASAIPGGLRVQAAEHPGGQRSFVILDMDAGAVHWRAERFLARFGEGTQRTYAFHLVDHLRWLAAAGCRPSGGRGRGR